MEESTYIVDEDGRKRLIHNLDWLMRHRAEVERVDVYPLEDHRWRVYAIVGRYVYHTVFADKTVCQQWFSRRGWKGIPVTFYQP